MGRLSGKVVIGTGGASGIGGAISLALAREGAFLAIADIDLSLAKETAQEIQLLGSKAIAVKTEVSKSEDINNMVAKTMQNFGKMDVLVNYAGIGKATGTLASPDHTLFENLTEAERDKVLNMNLKSSARSRAERNSGHASQSWEPTSTTQNQSKRTSRALLRK